MDTGINRLAELQRSAGRQVNGDNRSMEMEEKASSGAGSEDQVNMNAYKPIKESMENIKKNIGRIEKLKKQEKTTVSEEARKDIMAELDVLMKETTDEGASCKRQFMAIKDSNEKFAKKNKGSAQAQIRVNLYQTHIRRFHQLMNNYQQASLDFKKALKARMRRQLGIVATDKDMTPEQIDEIIESGHAEEVIGEVLIGEELDNVVREIEERHKGILRIEKQIKEIYELYRDLLTLVELQQETLDVIDMRIKAARDYTVEAEKDLTKAEGHQKSARKRQCMILMIILAVGIAIIAFSVTMKDG